MEAWKLCPRGVSDINTLCSVTIHLPQTERRDFAVVQPHTAGWGLSLANRVIVWLADGEILVVDNGFQGCLIQGWTKCRVAVPMGVLRPWGHRGCIMIWGRTRVVCLPVASGNLRGTLSLCCPCFCFAFDIS